MLVHVALAVARRDGMSESWAPFAASAASLSDERRCSGFSGNVGERFGMGPCAHCRAFSRNCTLGVMAVLVLAISASSGRLSHPAQGWMR